ncbi:hypothetical protein FSP39_013537 [Pinctada imbricata]|uniref:Protein-serine O-palmitoleoyltransferase porcupine-like n=1 Tax=Pinctada imbricata TaxID=66713 RepID=A0AA89C1P1_PINIB|nr:hypothetical protein FSP39_013537 [Pinctada imbricata]
MDYDVYYDDVMGDSLLQDYYDEEELEELLRAYQDGYYGDDPEVTRMPLLELVNNCLIPTLTQTLQMLGPLYAMCFIFRLICLFLRSGSQLSSFPKVHITSAILGLFTLNYFFGATIIYLLICCLTVYVILVLTSQKCPRQSGVCVAVFVVIYIVVCELFVVDAASWHSIRGAQIILSMKVIGLAFDISNGQVLLPDVPSYLGYCLCVGTVIFGPWISFQDYMNILFSGTSVLDVQWILKVVRSSVIGVLCMTYSTCFVNWIFMDDYHKWILAYKDAQSFRFSHYFVCFISEATATLAGIGYGDLQWNLSVSKPQHIEIPRSLVDVVTNWNLPMHRWLKNCYSGSFGSSQGDSTGLFSDRSNAVGLNFQLAAVLFSLGFYSYVEYVFREKLSRIYSACLLSKSCTEPCEHQYKSTNPYVIITNLGFGLLSVFHLAYLGLMFDSSESAQEGYTMSHTLEKWSNLGYLSHFVLLGTFIFHLLI